MTDPASSSAATYAAYLAALRAGNRRAAFAVVDRAADDGMQLGDVYMDVFQPALREIGRLWQENQISVADEHLATAITQAAMARLFERSFEWSDEGRPSILAACGDTERHEVGLRMLCDMLEARGWNADYLGASVPVESLVQMVTARRPTVVALSVALPPHVPRLRAMVTALRAALGDATPVIIAGGRPLLDDPSLAEYVGADLTAPSAAEAVRLLEERVGQQ
jgi:methanogenic corrinoid protein MtbC1